MFVITERTDQRSATFGDIALIGGKKTIRLDQFESIPVWASWRRL
jgi:hypothetical protein